jgi:hypothetical protein
VGGGYQSFRASNVFARSNQVKGLTVANSNNLSKPVRRCRTGNHSAAAESAQIGTRVVCASEHSWSSPSKEQATGQQEKSEDGVD